MSSVMIYFKYLIKTILSNISPNKSIFNVVVVCIRTFLLNLKYSFKNFYKLPSKIYSDDISKSSFWTNALTHLRFVNYFYDRKNILKAPIIKIVAGGFLRDLSNIDYKNQNIDIITDKAANKIIKEFNYLNYNSVYDWLDTYNQSLKNEKITFESYKNIKDLSVLEIGPGIGFNSLIYESFTSKDIYFYDFKEFLDIQKKILKNFDNLLDKVNFFSDIDLLKEKLKDKDYFVTSYWAFSEFNMEDRKMFYKVIENASFSLFLSNPNFEDVSNHVFFNDLSKKINKKLLVIPFEKKNQPGFTKAHNYYILY